MALNMNRVVVSGNLTQDPELRTTPSGTSVCDLRLAVNGREKIGEEWRDRTEFIDITVWGSQGEACAKYLSRGSPVAIDGRLHYSQWEDNSGAKRSRLKIVADTVQFLPRAGDGEAQQQTVGAAATERDWSTVVAPDDDIPF